MSRPEAALSHARRAVELRPRDREARLALGWAALEQEEQSLAAETFASLVDDADLPLADRREAASGLALARYRLGAHAEALGRLQWVLDETPGWTGGWLTAGWAAYFIGHYEQAASCFLRARLLDPGLCEALRGHALSLYRLNRLEPAAEELRRTLQLCPAEQRPTIHLELAWALFAQQRWAAADSHFAQALELLPGDPDALAGRGWCAFQLGDYYAARQAFEAALARQPDHSLALQGLAALAPPVPGRSTSAGP
jgi:tetratricopeptide (TPR) repeat protein